MKHKTKKTDHNNIKQALKYIIQNTVRMTLYVEFWIFKVSRNNFTCNCKQAKSTSYITEKIRWQWYQSKQKIFLKPFLLCSETITCYSIWLFFIIRWSLLVFKENYRSFMGDTIGKSRSGGLGTLKYLFSFFGFQNGSHEIIHIVVLPITRFPILVNWLIFTVTTWY